MTGTNYTQSYAENERKEILTAFDTDKNAQECLRLYRLLPESEKKNMLHAMGAFLRGFTDGMVAGEAMAVGKR